MTTPSDATPPSTGASIPTSHKSLPSTPEPNYRLTIFACFGSFFVQSIVVNFLPLLFLTLQKEWGLSLLDLAGLTALNFLVQLTVDFLSIFFVDRWSYRLQLTLAQVLAAVGLMGLALFPQLGIPTLPALQIAVICYGIGGGLIEVLTSPVVAATPSRHKSSLMSLTHSFYCWGTVLVVLLSTLYFLIFGRESWRPLSYFWAVVPLLNAILFARAPLPPGLGVTEEVSAGSVAASSTAQPKASSKGRELRALFSEPLVYFFVFLMLASGAMEQALAQWVSAFAEAGLALPKALGDLMGPLFFSVTMGTARLLHARYKGKRSLEELLFLSALLGFGSFILMALAPHPLGSFIGCGLAGFATGILWPAILTLASDDMPGVSTSLFALMALAGDIGCSVGPLLVATVTRHEATELARGILAASVFPLVLIFGFGWLLWRNEKAQRAA